MAGGIREHSGDDEDMDVSHEINVTPFIDVMLVLLIIFMVAAPLSTVDVNVDLPTANAPPSAREDQPIFVSLRSDLTLAIGNDDLPRETLGTALDTATGNQRDRRIFLRADQSVPYGDLMAVMNLMRSAGYVQIALVAQEGAMAQSAPPPHDTAAPEPVAPRGP
ncbi:TonB system transport protein ExbD [Ketogulonicigenium vulgare]|uniref:TonB system transport protein ExbD n=1 Tax=Ketogulonicigenium vulgare TaxID=92945 RepID=UPI002358169A|nr:TonB system transport protein ExbD [Ketogulonicigenium vulgare]